MRLAGLLLSFLLLAQSAPAQTLLLRDAILIDGTGAPARHIENMLIENGRITGFFDVILEEVPFDREIDLKGAWIIPGLIDAHVHLSGFDGDRREMQDRLERALRGGVTAVRDMAGDARVLKDTVDGLRQGDYLGPEIVYSGLVGGPDMFDDPRVLEASQGYEAGTAPWLRAYHAGDDADRIMEEIKHTGARAVKLYGNLNPEAVRILIPAARRAGLMTWAHATTFPARPSDLVEAGVDVLSHSAYFVWQAVLDVPDDYNARKNGPYSEYDPDSENYRMLVARMAQDKVLLDATLFVYYAYEKESGSLPAVGSTDTAFGWAAAFTALAHEAGVRIATGTDALLSEKKQEQDALPYLHSELELLVRHAGLTPLEALVAATRNSAEAAGLLEEHGTLEAGKIADLVVLNADPLRDIRATRDIRLVIRAGQVVEPDE
ncbi:amidohydrolase family protein [Emcibacter nanhaiensis]|uniref:Amidohydrolase family protein n=1 Tax=Emcibacter nanhaiensis TaxID=1505037 RepID=A0A501PAP0_9PROT|nr:amidohydrolase family protein [Emcibacter nanhaiensis]TPD57449.1 amidohydrolase family protein [Emcibacter nanhaiensis]